MKIKLDRKLENSYDVFKFVEELFNGVLDKGEHPYIEHLLAVADGVQGEEERICALLHDTLEDTEVTENVLRSMGIKEEVIVALKLVSREVGETYNDFIDRIVTSENLIALKVKLSDLKHNSDISRIPHPTEKDIKRVKNRYAPAREKIMNKLVELWHESDSEKEVYDFIGISKEEYRRWVENNANI